MEETNDTLKPFRIDFDKEIAYIEKLKNDKKLIEEEI